MPIALSRKKILIVDDDRMLNGSLQRKFQHLGYQTEGCFDGEEGLTLMQAEHFDGIVLDLMMPIKDGFAVLAKKGVTMNSDTPAFVLTSMDQAKCDLAKELGAYKTFDKVQMSPTEVAWQVEKDLAIA